MSNISHFLPMISKVGSQHEGLELNSKETEFLKGGGGTQKGLLNPFRLFPGYWPAQKKVIS